MSTVLDQIVDVTISRETQSVAKANFGIPGIAQQFPASKTTTTFGRYRYYASLSEMTDDGWATTDPMYKAVQALFQQNPRVEKALVGRLDSADASITAGLTAIQAAQSQWYAFAVLGENTAKVVFSEDFVTSNTIDFTINGTAISQVTFTTDQATTMAAIETAIETDLSGSVVTVDPADTTNRTLLISFPDTGIDSCSVAIAAGASQPTAVIDFRGIPADQDVKDAAAWAETQMKIFFYFTTEADAKGTATTDLLSFMNAQNYDRSVGVYYDPDTENSSDPEMGDYINLAWPGETLPYDAGSQTWAYKTLSGVAAYALTSSERGNVLGKNGNIYTDVAGVSVTEEGKVASGEWIDIIRGIDWITANLQETIFGELANVRKIPFTDEGIAVIDGLVRGVLSDAANQGILVNDSIVVTVPKAADVPTADKTARNLPDVNFTATLQGAIHKVEINGTVSV